MDPEIHSGREHTAPHLPRALVWGLFAVCAAPSLVAVAGIDLGASNAPLDLAAATGPDHTEALYDAVRGGIIHALLEWSAVAAACFTVILGFAHYRLRGDSVTLIITMALFWSGCMDAFHALAATRLLHGAADAENFIPFTWALSRSFNIGVLLVGIAVLRVRRHADGGPGRRSFVPLVGFSFGAVSYALIHICATSPVLPRTMYPDALITRPFDFIPLVLFGVAAAVVYPRFHHRQRTLFSLSLWLSAIPEIATELHMAFGSTSLFDSHFNSAHFLKVVAYAVPLGGLILEYVAAHRQLERTNRDLAQAKRVVERTADELRVANSELQQFAYVASHDLKAPLRAIDNLSHWIEEDAGRSLTGDSRDHLALLRGRVARMDALLEALLKYARVGRRQAAVESVDLEALVRELIDMHAPGEDMSFQFDDLPTLVTDRAAIQQVLGNLIGNAIKHHTRPDGHVAITAVEQPESWRITVSDDGPGIASSYHGKIFEMFQTLRPRDEVEGSGMGLALVKKQVASCGGTIELESAENAGASFRFTWPKVWPTNRGEDIDDQQHSARTPGR